MKFRVIQRSLPPYKEDKDHNSALIIILYYAIQGSTKVKNTKDKYTIKTYKIDRHPGI